MSYSTRRKLVRYVRQQACWACLAVAVVVLLLLLFLGRRALGSVPWPPWLIGYGVSVFVGHFLISRIREEAYKEIPHSERFRWHAQAVGLIERALYTSSWVAAKPEFIGLWLAIKVAGQWKRWTEEQEDPTVLRWGKQEQETVPARAYYNVFLIGNALSITYGVLGGIIIEWSRRGVGRLCAEQAHPLQYCVAAFVVVCTCILWAWVKWEVSRAPRQSRR